jgi:hypothetical protein
VTNTVAPSVPLSTAGGPATSVAVALNPVPTITIFRDLARDVTPIRTGPETRPRSETDAIPALVRRLGKRESREDPHVALHAFVNAGLQAFPVPYQRWRRFHDRICRCAVASLARGPVRSLGRRLPAETLGQIVRARASSTEQSA